MNIPFYDNLSLEPDSDGWTDIDRIYCFDWDSFDDALSDRLRDALTKLPEWKLRDEDGCHWWFSDHDDIDSGYLTAGVEPPGLQVFGSLQIDKWVEWDKNFQEVVRGFPVRQLE